MTHRPWPIAPLFTALLLALWLPSVRAAEPPPLIPRDVFFGEAEKESPRISPDGTRLAYLGKSPDGVVNIWARTLGADDDTMMTRQARSIPSFEWAPSGKQILFFQDKDGDENTRLYSMDVATGSIRDLTPFPEVRAQELITNPERPREALVGLNRRDPHVFDIHRVELKTGAVKLDTQNPGDVIAWTADRSLAIRAATAIDAKTGDTIIRVRDSAGAPWRDLVRWPFAEAGNDIYQRVISFNRDGDSLLIQSPVGANTTRLAKLSIKTGKEGPTIATDTRCDIWNTLWTVSLIAQAAVVLDPKTGEPQAVGFEYIQPEWKVLDPAVKDDFNNLYAAHRGVPFLVSRDAADRVWIVGYIVDNGATPYFVYDRSTKKASYLFTNHPALDDYKLPESQPLVLHARDGLELVSYLTLPPDVESHDLPLVLLVHGGPWWRDSWGYDPEVQWLADRGYAVLQVNYRGSSGFGKIHLNAGNGQFGPGAMQDDLTDAVAWAISDGTADPNRVAIAGSSYGGYAALTGLTYTPEIYACGVDIVGPTDMRTVIESFPAYSAPRRKRWILRVGNVLEDDALNQRISPLYHLDRIEVPLLIGQGANDPRVKIAQSDAIVKEMRARNLPVTYIVYPDEGHGFARPENAQDFHGRMEEFLAKRLWGRAEPWREIPGSTAEER